MKKNGFAFIETIVTVVILSASLLLLYSSYSSSFHNERNRLYYDDVAHIYMTNYIKKFLLQYSNVQYIKNKMFDSTYIETIGPDFDAMFTSEQNSKNLRTSFTNIFENYNVNQIAIMKKEYIDNCYEETSICKRSNENLSQGIVEYIKTLNETDNDYYLIIEYAEKNENGRVSKCMLTRDINCSTYYVSLGI